MSDPDNQWKTLREAELEHELAQMRAALEKARRVLRLAPKPPNVSDPPASRMVTVRTDWTQLAETALAEIEKVLKAREDK